MKDIRFKNFVEKKYFFRDSFVEYLGGGWEGSCYRRNDKTFKLYNNMYIKLFNDDEKLVNDLVKYRDLFIDNIYFIRALVYCEDFVIGSVCDYANGVPCAKFDLYGMDIDKLVNALKILKNNIFELSELGIFIEDEFLYNILFDGEIFKLIDTGRYYRRGDICSEWTMEEDLSEVYELNMKRMMSILLNRIIFFTLDGDASINQYLSDRNSIYKDYLVDKDLLMNPEITIDGIRRFIQEDIGKEITSFKECEKELLRIKKR